MQGLKKNNWLKYLNIYYNLQKTRLKEDDSIEKLKSDYRSEQLSYKADK